MVQPSPPGQLTPTHPMIINLPPPQPLSLSSQPSRPDTPSETPGTPTSTTTSLSAVSTTAIKDGQRGTHIPLFVGGGSSGGGGGGANSGGRGHHHQGSTNSLEAERADRISRLAGLSNVSTLRAHYGPARGSLASGGSRYGGGGGANTGLSPFSTPSSTAGMAGMAVPGPLTPAYFDAQGQPVAITKMSTVGTASATDSAADNLSVRTLGETTNDDDSSMQDEDEDEDDDDDISLGDANYRNSGRGRGRGGDQGGDDDPMDDDSLDASSTRFDDRDHDRDRDRLSDDGSVSLVGFGEGAGSTVSGPIYRRHFVAASSGSVLSGTGPTTATPGSTPMRAAPPSSAGAMANAMASAMASAAAAHGIGPAFWALDRNSSGGGGSSSMAMSDVALSGSVANSTNGITNGDMAMSAAGLQAYRREYGFTDSPGSGDNSSADGGGGPGAAAENNGNHRSHHSHHDAYYYTTDAEASRDNGSGIDNSDDVFIDTGSSGGGRGPVPVFVGSEPGSATSSPHNGSRINSTASPPLLGNVIQAQPSALRETQRPRSHQQRQQQHAQRQRRAHHRASTRGSDGSRGPGNFGRGSSTGTST